MNTMTLDQVLTGAENLAADEKEILAELLQKRRIEFWRKETAAEADKAAKAYRSGKLKAESLFENSTALPREGTRPTGNNQIQPIL